MQLSAIPQELIDYIIDHLHDDTETLKSCTLACSLFLHRCSLHLFRHITLGGTPSISPSRLLASFLDVLKQSPRICRCVEKFIFTTSLPVRRRFQNQTEALTVDLSTLSDVLAHLDHLHTVVLRLVGVLPLRSEGHTALLPHRRLRKVVLGASYSSTGEQDPYLQDLLAIFEGTAIDELEVLGIWNGAPRKAAVCPIHVSSLWFIERRADVSNVCLEALRHAIDPACLVALRASLTGLGSLEALNALIEQAGPNIQSLRFDLEGMTNTCASLLPSSSGEEHS